MNAPGPSIPEQPDQDTSVSPEQKQGRVSHLLKDVFFAIGRYARGQILIVLIMSALYTVGFYFVQVPLCWLAGALCGPFHLIPLIGVIFSAAIPVTLLLVGGGGFWEVVWVLVVLAVVQLLESFYLTPKILGRELQLHPVLIIFLVLGGALLFGPIGALLAAPIVAIGLLVWRSLARKHKPDLT